MVDIADVDIAKRIRELRLSQKMTLEQVAKEVGVGKSTVRKWETGMIANMRRDKIAALARALHTTPEFLIGWETSESDGSKTEANQEENVIRIAGRNGRYIERRLTDDQIAAFAAMLDQMPDVPDDL